MLGTIKPCRILTNCLLSELPHPRLDPRTPAAVRSILLIATKYQVDHIRQRIVKRLEADWPQNVAQWERLDAEIDRAMTQNFLWNFVPSFTVDDIFPEPVSAICLARECNITSILPAAFYQLSRIGIAYDWEEMRKPESGIISIFRTARWSLLSAEDLRRLQLGKAKLKEYMDSKILYCNCRHSRGPEPDCCITYEYSMEVRKTLGMAAVVDLLRGFREILHDIEVEGVCNECRTLYMAVLDRGALWDSLTDFFSLD